MPFACEVTSLSPRVSPPKLLGRQDRRSRVEDHRNSPPIRQGREPIDQRCQLRQICRVTLLLNHLAKDDVAILIH
eukprot:7384818-Prymnesium_polylepis.3